MALGALAARMLAEEARALLTRLARIKPFALLEPMVGAAALLPGAELAIERELATGRRELARRVHDFLEWLRGPEANAGSAAEAQRRFAFLRLRFNAALTQFDLFNDVITQRSEQDTGVWLAGLDVVSTDALELPGDFYRPPPVVCYLDRGAGAAIRRARTRLPGGGSNPVAIIRVPRERMLGSGIASSLIHEVGHQGAALLDLVNSLRQVLQGLQQGAGSGRLEWQLWERWISEIVADFWAVARVGITSTLGLIGVVGLPRAFVFRAELDDPHPVPWIRVRLSCAMGQALYPHPQWSELSALWESFYPLDGVDRERHELFRQLEASIPALLTLLLQHRPRSLRGERLMDVLATSERHPARLSGLYSDWQRRPEAMYRARPSLVFAVLGQARAARRASPELESELLSKLLKHWALESSRRRSRAFARAI